MKRVPVPQTSKEREVMKSRCSFLVKTIYVLVVMFATLALTEWFFDESAVTSTIKELDDIPVETDSGLFNNELST